MDYSSILRQQASILYETGQKKIIKAGAANYGQASIIMAEVRALRDGFRVAHQAGYNKVETEGDNLIVIQALN